MLKITAKRKSITLEIACRDLVVLTGLFIASGGQFAPGDAGSTLPPAFTADEPAGADSDNRPHRQFRPLPRRNAGPRGFTVPPPGPETPEMDEPRIEQEPYPAQPGPEPNAETPCTRALPQPGWSSYLLRPGPLSAKPEPALQVLRVVGQAGRACRLNEQPKP